MASFGKNIVNFNKEILSVVTDLRAHGYDPFNLLPQLFTTYDYCSPDIGPFKCYIGVLKNMYNYRTLNLESKDIMNKAELKFKDIKDNLKFKGSSKSEDPILPLNG